MQKKFENVLHNQNLICIFAAVKKGIMPRYLESHIQQKCVEWFRLQYKDLRPLLFSVPNGGKRDRITAVIMTKEGIVAGVSDLLFLYPSRGYHGLCIEMKTKEGVQSEHQKEWQAAVEQQGYKYVICRNFPQFYNLIRFWLMEIDKVEYDVLKDKN